MKPSKTTATRATGHDAWADKHTCRLGIALVILVCLAGFIYLHFSWHRYHTSEALKVINLGDTVGALLNTADIEALSVSPGDNQLAAYQDISQSLTRMVKVNTSIAHAYLVCMSNDAPILLLESGTSTMTRKTSPGTIFLDEATLIKAAWGSSDTLFTDAVKNARGEWVSTLTPIYANASPTPVAVLGISYPLGPWNMHIMEHMMTDILVVLSVIILTFALVRIITEHISLQKRSRILARDMALFHGLFEQAPVGISIIGNDKVANYSPDERYSVNHMYEEILGRNKAELEQTDWQSITHPDDLEADLALLKRYHAGEIDHYTIEKRFIRPDGSLVWTNLTIGALTSDSRQGKLHLCILEDISARKNMEQALRESERSKAVLLSHLPGLAYRCKYDRNWTMEFVSQGCETLTGYAPESLVANRDLSYNDLVAPEYREPLWAEWKLALVQNRHFRQEYEIITRDGTRKWVLEHGQFIFCADGSIEALEGIVIDISELKMRESQISYLNEHDFLTGLFNRGHFEREKNRLADAASMPLSIAVCDIDGVRLVNDAFGLSEGDRLISDVAYILQTFVRDSDVLCRTGGDDFTLLMPNTTSKQAAALTERIAHAVERYNQSEQVRLVEISLSFGVCTMAEGMTVEQTLAAAEERLKHRKILMQKSSHSAILSSIMATLYARSQETEEHGKRLTHLTRQIGERMGLPSGTLDDLELLSMLHDIGKVGVSDRILNKPARLDAEEWEMMKLHSEIGYRIALSSPELEHIAIYILSHHEQWDGQGYPFGLKGDAIPLPARILAVADAYDAMTEDRVYRPAMPKADAIAEITRCAGTQFDPTVAHIFVELMNAHDVQSEQNAQGESSAQEAHETPGIPGEQDGASAQDSQGTPSAQETHATPGIPGEQDGASAHGTQGAQSESSAQEAHETPDIPGEQDGTFAQDVQGTPSAQEAPGIPGEQDGTSAQGTQGAQSESSAQESHEAPDIPGELDGTSANDAQGTRHPTYNGL